jgi:hypothetical protein
MTNAKGSTRATIGEGLWRLAARQTSITGNRRDPIGTEFAKLAFAHVDRSIEWHAKGIGNRHRGAPEELNARSILPTIFPRYELSRLVVTA